MYIVVIAWLYVAILMALTETSVIAGVATFLFYGALPLVIVVYLGGAGVRRRRRLLADQCADDDDGSNSEHNQ